MPDIMTTLFTNCDYDYSYDKDQRVCSKTITVANVTYKDNELVKIEVLDKKVETYVVG